MKKPELNDFKRDVYDGAHEAEWYQEYYKALEKYTKQLESTNQQLIEALMGVHKIFGDEYKYDSSHRGAIMAKIKTALRDAIDLENEQE